MLTSSAKPIAKKGLESTASCYFFLEENSVVHYSHTMIKNHLYNTFYDSSVSTHRSIYQYFSSGDEDVLNLKKL